MFLSRHDCFTGQAMTISPAGDLPFRVGSSPQIFEYVAISHDATTQRTMGLESPHEQEDVMTTPLSHLSRRTDLESMLGILRNRKTRRFGCGMEIPEGPLRFQSQLPPVPLSKEELHYLLFAGVGQTGMHLGDMQYAPRRGGEDGQGMAIMRDRKSVV